jgi:hypothetical protein
MVQLGFRSVSLSWSMRSSKCSFVWSLETAVDRCEIDFVASRAHPVFFDPSEIFGSSLLIGQIRGSHLMTSFMSNNMGCLCMYHTYIPSTCYLLEANSIAMEFASKRYAAFSKFFEDYTVDDA